MNKNFRTAVFFLVLFFYLQNLAAQQDSMPVLKKDSISVSKTYRVGIFAPLYLDSVFNEEGKFRYKQGMPRFIMPGIDFVNGAQIALDSVKFQNQNVDAYIYDTKSYTSPCSFYAPIL